MEYRQKLQKIVIGTQFSSFSSIFSVIKANKLSWESKAFMSPFYPAYRQKEKKIQ